MTGLPTRRKTFSSRPWQCAGLTSHTLPLRKPGSFCRLSAKWYIAANRAHASGVRKFMNAYPMLHLCLKSTGIYKKSKSNWKPSSWSLTASMSRVYLFGMLRSIAVVHHSGKGFARASAAEGQSSSPGASGGGALACAAPLCASTRTNSVRRLRSVLPPVSTNPPTAAPPPPLPSASGRANPSTSEDRRCDSLLGLPGEHGGLAAVNAGLGAAVEQRSSRGAFVRRFARVGTGGQAAQAGTGAATFSLGIDGLQGARAP
mmetsp:Transcript_6524/g.20993  ORF Transcript_6524/g.20993 Transcript_6524/m.20993 type:complete len:259 (-) Transcript_6524:838-1614(-)